MSNGLGKFGEYVFSDHVMKEKLPSNIYHKLQSAKMENIPLDLSTAEVIASVMKEWAISFGATHYTHWFSPMTGKTAEKHEAFISPMQDGNAIYEFSGKALIQGEADASSFPSGGLRATFEARGYTAWDYSFPAFIRHDPQGIIALCIPTLFCSYTGEALDTRIPLVRSIERLNKQAVRLLRILGDKTVKKVMPYVGLEQEYFLIDREKFKMRSDIRYTGRTLFGAQPPKGQELSDQYYGTVRQSVSKFMAELNDELWRLGIPAKTQHNEVAPAQHEVAVVFDHVVAACDQNELTMMLLKKVAARQNMACLLHEKPFSGFNGSGKHNNWSLATDTGINLLDPGPEIKNTSQQFLLFLMAVISAVDKYPELLRFACSGLGNDNRLGGNEAPPPIISVFLGDALLNKLSEEAKVKINNDYKAGADFSCNDLTNLMSLEADDSDRNRTSPFAFTGNKFEFRMPGSSQNPDTINMIINTIVAEQISIISNKLEKNGANEESISNILNELFVKHNKIIFNGNNYCKSWTSEALSRGLPIISSSADAIAALITEKTKKLMTSQGVLSEKELLSRSRVQWEIFIKSINIEAKTMLNMQRKNVLPAALNYQKDLIDALVQMQNTKYSTSVIEETLNKLQPLILTLNENLKQLEDLLSILVLEPSHKNAKKWQSQIMPVMGNIRNCSDLLENFIPAKMWPYPTYEEILYY